MYKEKPVKINRGDNPHHFLTVVILLAFAVVISLVIAIVWQKVSDKGADLSNPNRRNRNCPCSTEQCPNQNV